MSLRADFLRFAKLHSWYKHIPLEGADFWVYLDEGQQPRNGICAEVEDWTGAHWHFSCNGPPRDGRTSYKVRFGPFLRGDRRGLHLIAELAEFPTWCAQHYPNLTGGSMDSMLTIAVAEQERYWQRLLEAVQSAT